MASQIQHPWNIQKNMCLCSWNGSDFSSCGHLHVEIGPDPSSSCLHSSHNFVTTTQLLQSWDLTSVDLHQCLGENNIQESPGPISHTPTVKARLRAMATTVYYFVNPHKWWKRTLQSILTGEQLQRRIIPWLLSQWECSNLTYFTSHLKNRSGGPHSNNYGADSPLKGQW